MKTDYHKRLLPVIRHLEAHFDEPLNLEEVAALAHLSPYHFHRIFKAVTGETLNEHLRRLRLEKVATLLFYRKLSVTETALSFGFSSSQSLAKAFKQHFALTPSQVRECESISEFAELLRNSKIGHTLRKNGHVEKRSSAYTRMKSHTGSITMDMQHFPASHLAFVRVTGEYGKNYEPATQKLYQWASPRGLADNTCIFIYHDNPEITPAEKCRTDVCLLLDGAVEGNNDVEIKPFTGGHYACMRRTITDVKQYPLAWDELMEQLVEQGLDSDDRPCFELYHSYDPQTHHADVSFCTAIKA
ncbi:AraC family transcriptional regulator [Vibrio navarrensis]|uniref:AraC family transcriptional regulator n=1 Tax=Vibrio navarrensis TaxID=29495 RepID=A0AAJ4LW77_9VIBR|nr:AraC family transcriptional regulator [Vibrio navarrensis]